MQPAISPPAFRTTTNLKAARLFSTNRHRRTNALVFMGNSYPAIDKENPFTGIFPPQPWENEPSSQVGSGNIHETQIPPVPTAFSEAAVTTPNRTPAASSRRSQPRKRNKGPRPKLVLLQCEEWDRNKPYDEDRLLASTTLSNGE